MNERIRELADKIWAEEYWSNPNTDKLLPAQLNRFAELIVRETFKVCTTNMGYSELVHMREQVKKTFGVEE